MFKTILGYYLLILYYLIGDGFFLGSDSSEGLGGLGEEVFLILLGSESLEGLVEETFFI